MTRTLVSKSEYARRRNRSPATVTQWLNTGKIRPESVEAGRIILELADRDLAQSLRSEGQAGTENALTLPVPGDDDDETAEGSLSDFARRAKAIADRAVEQAIAAKRENAIEDGRWLNREDAERAWGREFTATMNSIENFMLTTMCREIAATHNLDWREVSSQVRRLWREFRTEASQTAA